MLATLTDQPFSREGWLFEPKLDGERCLVFRREIVWSDGRRERTVEIKSLRTPTLVESMTSAKAAPANAPAPETEKPTAPEKQ